MLTIKELKDIIMQNIELGNAIRNARISRNLSQEDFSEMIGISPTHLKHIESEHRKPSIEVLFRIVQTLNMSLDNILFSQDDKNQQFINEINNLLPGCTENELQIILDLIYSLRKHSV